MHFKHGQWPVGRQQASQAPAHHAAALLAEEGQQRLAPLHASGVVGIDAHTLVHEIQALGCTRSGSTDVFGHACHARHQIAAVLQSCGAHPAAPSQRPLCAHSAPSWGYRPNPLQGTKQHALFRTTALAVLLARMASNKFAHLPGGFA